MLQTSVMLLSTFQHTIGHFELRLTHLPHHCNALSHLLDGNALPIRKTTTQFEYFYFATSRASMELTQQHGAARTMNTVISNEIFPAILLRFGFTWMLSCVSVSMDFSTSTNRSICFSATFYRTTDITKWGNYTVHGNIFKMYVFCMNELNIFASIFFLSVSSRL